LLGEEGWGGALDIKLKFYQGQDPFRGFELLKIYLPKVVLLLLLIKICCLRNKSILLFTKF
jgi:hypothetical protein